MPRARWEALARIRAKKGLKTKHIDGAPQLYPELQLGWGAWEELSMSRPYKPNGLPASVLHSEIESWLNLNMIRDDLLRLDLYRWIKILDVGYLAESKLMREEAADGNA